MMIFTVMCVIISMVAMIYWITHRSHSEGYVITYNPYHPPIYRVPLEDRIDLAIDDKHNVHNQTLKRTAGQVIHQLQQCDQKIYSVPSSIDEIEQIIELHPNTDIEKLDNALYSLHTISQLDAIYHMRETTPREAGIPIEIPEKEVLRLIWERIHHPINTEHRSELIESFIDQLADCCGETGSVHCCEGRIMRLLQTLELNDHDPTLVDLKPMWAYREEIAHQITRYRDKLLQKVPYRYQALETKSQLTLHDQELLDQFNRCLIRNLNKRFEIDYVSKGLLTTDEITDLTKVYYESLYEI